jgi:hypothetical protein
VEVLNEPTDSLDEQSARRVEERWSRLAADNLCLEYEKCVVEALDGSADLRDTVRRCSHAQDQAFGRCEIEGVQAHRPGNAIGIRRQLDLSVAERIEGKPTGS